MATLNKIFSAIDESFNKGNAGHYELSLLAGEKHVSYSVFDAERNHYLAVESYRNTLSDLNEPGSMIRLPYRNIRIIIENRRSTLVPAELFDPSEMNTYLSPTVDLTGNDRYFHDRLLQPEIVTVYAVTESVAAELDDLFPGRKTCHLSTVLMDTIWMFYKNQLPGTRMFIHIGEEDFSLLIFDKKALIYNNSFHYQTPEDLVYYVIFVMEQLDLNPEEIPLTVMGKIDREAPLFELLFRYIRRIDFAMRNEAVGFSPVFNTIPEHYFFPLLNQGSCGS
jgi:hypothetical protein